MKSFLSFDELLGCKVKKIHRNLCFETVDCCGIPCLSYLYLVEIEPVDAASFCVLYCCGDAEAHDSTVICDDWYKSFKDALVHYHRAIIDLMKRGKL